MIEICSEDIQKAETVLLPQNCHFDDERINFVKKLSSLDLLAVPGSGKTTALQAKLLCLSQSLSLLDGAGVLVLSHTNAAVGELCSKLQCYVPVLFEYPNFIGTVQDFVDTFLTNPYYHYKYGHKIEIIDSERYKEEIFGYLQSQKCYASTYISNNLSQKDIVMLRVRNHDNNDKLFCGFSENVFEIKSAKKWINEGTVTKNVNRIEKFIIKMKNYLLCKGVLDYDDCYILANEYIEIFPEVIDFIRGRFKFIFVDEAQDLKKHQLDLLDLLFNNDSVCYQRIGDPNQSIYSEIKEACEWETRNENFLSNSHRLTPEIAGIVNNLKLKSDFGDNSSYIVKGLRRLDNQIKPHLVLYNLEKASFLKKHFSKLIKQYKLDKTYEGDKYGFHIIGWSGEKSDNQEHLRLENLFSEYVKKNSVTTVVRENLSDYLHCYNRELSINDCQKSILNCLCRCLKILDVRKSDGVLFNRIDLKSYIKQKGELYNEQFRLLVFNVSKDMFFKQFSDAYIKMKKYICTQFMKLFDTTVNGDLDTFIGNGYVPLCREMVESESFSMPDDDSDIKVETVHSVKGSTHCATMYVETFFYKYESEHLLKKPCKKKKLDYESPLFGSTIDYETKQTKMAKKMLYVGFSRPTHLLCYASLKSLWNDVTIEKMRNAGWEIDDLTTMG